MDTEAEKSASRDREPSTYLYELVHSLTRGERKYFKQYINIQEGGKSYLQLFNVLENQKSFNDEEIFLALQADFKNQNNYRVKKQYLAATLLKAMRSYPTAESTVDKDIKGKIVDIRFLIEKALYSQADKELRKLKLIAKTYERYIDLIEINALDFMLINSMLEIKDVSLKCEALYSDFVGCTEKVTNYFKYLHDYTIQEIPAKSVVFDIKGERALLKPLPPKQIKVKPTDTPLTLDAKLLYQLMVHFNQQVWFYEGEPQDPQWWKETVTKELNFLKDLQTEYKEELEAVPALYMSLLANIAVQARVGTKGLDMLEILQTIHFNGSRLNFQKQYLIYWLKLSLHNYGLKVDSQLINEVDDIKKYIAQYGDKLRPDERTRLQFVFASFLFNNKLFEDAKYFLKKNIIGYSKKIIVRKDIITASYLLLLVCDYELMDHADIGSHTLDVFHFTKANPTELDIRVKVIINFFKKLSRTGLPAKRDLIESVVNELGDFKHGINKYFQFRDWFKSKLELTR